MIVLAGINDLDLAVIVECWFQRLTSKRCEKRNRRMVGNDDVIVRLVHIRIGEVESSFALQI